MQTYGRPATGLAFLYRKPFMPPSSQQAYQSVQDFSKNRRSTQDIQKEAEDKYNVSGVSSRLSGLRTMVGNLESSLENVDPSVRGRNSGGFVTEAQNQALVNREQQPILGNLAKQQRAYGDAQQEFSLSSALAGDLARSIRSDDETAYQRLLDQYNAATAQEQAVESKRQFDLQQKAAAKSASPNYVSDALAAFNAGGGGQQSSTPVADPTQQKAYNDVKAIVDSKDSNWIQKNYVGIKKSAANGNALDKVKLALIEQLYPAVKNFGSNTVSLARSIPTAVSLTPSYSGLSVGTARPGTLAVR